MTRKIEVDEIRWTEISPSARSKEWIGKGKRIRVLELRPEFEEAGWCGRAHVVHVLAGELEVIFMGEVERLTAGDTAVIAPEDKHKARALTPVARLLLIEDAG
jgi:mannose-6-phosphate isomerase-like protein (cupin superfamily)